MDAIAENRRLTNEALIANKKVARLRELCVQHGIPESEIHNALMLDRQTVPVEEVTGGEGQEQDGGSGEGGETTTQEPGHGSSPGGTPGEDIPDEEPGQGGETPADERPEADQGT